MPRWLKVVLGVVGGLVLLCVGSGLAGARWLEQNKDSLKASGDEAKALGRAQGGQGDDEACVSTGLARLKTKRGIVDQALTKIFVEACLEVAPRSPGFCDGVPASTALIETATWAIARCTARPPGVDDQDCARMMQAVQKSCAAR